MQLEPDDNLNYQNLGRILCNGKSSEHNITVILRMVQSNVRNSIPGIYRESNFVRQSLNVFTPLVKPSF